MTWQKIGIYTGPCSVAQTAEQIKAACGCPVTTGTERVYVEVMADDRRDAKAKLGLAIKYKYGVDHWLVRELAR